MNRREFWDYNDGHPDAYYAEEEARRRRPGDEDILPWGDPEPGDEPYYGDEDAWEDGSMVDDPSCERDDDDPE